MPFNEADRTVLRELARRIREIAALPVMQRRRELWKKHNALRGERPMILVFPEGSWRELLTDDELSCTQEQARKIEWGLRSRIYYHEHLPDDTVIEGDYIVKKVVRSSGWGLQASTRPSTEARGAWAFDPVIRGHQDLQKLRAPQITHDEQATQRNLEEAQDLFGDILNVRLKGVDHVGFHPVAQYVRLRGLAEAMMDMAGEPQMMHDAMEILTQGHLGIIRQYKQQNLLALNNDGTYHSSGGVGYTDELPQGDFDGEHVRPCDMWASAEAQELAQVGPQMHAEFAIAYEKRLLEPFGLNGYGCCEDLTEKLDYVFEMPNMRRISISPFADVERCAEQMKGDYIFSWKPHPAHLIGEFCEQRIRTYIRRTLRVAAEHGCVLEMVLKDTHTCEHRPERFTRWIEIAREEVERAAALGTSASHERP